MPTLIALIVYRDWNSTRGSLHTTPRPTLHGSTTPHHRHTTLRSCRHRIQQRTRPLQGRRTVRSHTRLDLSPRLYSPHRSRTVTYPASAVGPTCSPSLRDLRAIFKRTSAGLANEQRQRAESLKELIGGPNLRDAGIPGGGTVPTGLMDEAQNSGELVRETTVTW
ncbi:hypothetical protein EDB84DRAFT_1516861 [Lactarius hengduanensis]|nr:hypothetical protein EDB84DRAFT_1516861 [Lactarius hengduanensis]